MSFSKRMKTEHSGDKGSSRSSGYWGTRAEIKSMARKIRRVRGKDEVRRQLAGRE